MQMNEENYIVASELTEKKFDKILLSFLFAEPFFADIIRSLRRVQTKSIPTAGVGFDGNSIVLYYNPEFLEGLTKLQVFGLLKHECYHIIYRHISSRKRKPHLIWNIATDLAINTTIPEEELPEGGFIPGKAFDKLKDTKISKELLEKRSKFSDLIESFPPYKSSEWYMNKLMEDKETQEMIEELMSGCNCSSLSGEGSPGDGESESGEGASGNGKGMGLGFDHHYDEELSDGDKDYVDEKIKDILKEAVKKADKNRNWGSAPASLSDSLRAYLFKGVEWKKVLRYFCGTKQRANKSRTFKKINRKYPYLHPGSKVGRTSNIAVYIDQSGSVSPGELQLFFSALNDLAKKTTFTIFHFDCTVDEKSRYVWKKNKRIDKAYRTRGGGTCFTSVEKFHRKVQAEFDGYIIFTDGGAPKPIICKSKRCWVLLPGTTTPFTPDKRDVVVTMDNKI